MMPRTDWQQRELFRLFYLEDDPALSDDIRAILSHELPGLTIDWAGTIDDGLALIDEGRKYDLGLLDVRVPRRAHCHPEAIPDVALALRDRDTALLIYSGYLDSPDVQEFLHRKLTDPPLGVISKRVDAGLSDEIVTAIREWLVELTSQRLGTKMRQLFEVPSQGDLNFRGTGALIGLQQDILDHWSYLNSEARRLIASRFDIREVDGKIVALTLTPAGM